MRKDFLFLTVLLSAILFSVTLQAQESEAALKQKKIGYLSQKMSVSTATAAKIVSILDGYRNASNQIYHDSTLTTAQRVEKLKALRIEKDRKLEAIAATEGAKGKMAPLLKKNRAKQTPNLISR